MKETSLIPQTSLLPIPLARIEFPLKFLSGIGSLASHSPSLSDTENPKLMEMHKKQTVLFNGFSRQLRVKWQQQREGKKRTQAKYILDFQQGPNKSVWLYLLTYFNVSENQWS